MQADTTPVIFLSEAAAARAAVDTRKVYAEQYGVPYLPKQQKIFRHKRRGAICGYTLRMQHGILTEQDFADTLALLARQDAA